MAESDRREFLTGKSWLAAARELADSVVPIDPLPPNRGDSGYLVSYTRRAMACDFSIWLPASAPPEATAAALESLDLVEQLEAQLTIYRDTSEISAINRSAFAEPVTVEPRLWQLLRQARDLWQATNGAYDITSGPLSKLWGFNTRQGRLPQPDEVEATLANVGSQYLELDELAQTVRFLHPGLQINLGSIGKGYALDRCAEIFAAHAVADFLLHGGNSSVLAHGLPRASEASQSAAPHAEEGWWIGLRDPLRPERRILEVRLGNRAAGTSGAAVQHFLHQGKRYGHILDPRTGWPAESVLSVTVLAESSALADALSTACYVLGRDKGLDYLATLPNVAALVFTPGQKSSEWELTTQGLQSQEIRHVAG